MKKLIKFPSIEQFRNIVHNVNTHSAFERLDENNEPNYN